MNIAFRVLALSLGVFMFAVGFLPGQVGAQAEPTVEFVSAEVVVLDEGDGQFALYEITFDIEAHDADLYLPEKLGRLNEVSASGASVPADAGILYILQENGIVESAGGMTTSVITVQDIVGHIEELPDSYVLESGEIGRFALSVVYEPEKSGLYRMAIPFLQFHNGNQSNTRLMQMRDTLHTDYVYVNVEA